MHGDVTSCAAHGSIEKIRQGRESPGMSVARGLMTRRTVALIFLLLIVPPAILARPVASIWLERDVEECEIIVVATVGRVEAGGVKDKVRPGSFVGGKPFSESVQVLNVSYRPVYVIKGNLKTDATYTFQNYLLKGIPDPLYASHFAELKQGTSCLLFLKRSVDGELELAAPEEAPVSFNPQTLEKVKALPVSDKKLDTLVEILLLRIESQQPDMYSAVWMLSISSTLKEKAKDTDFRKRVVEPLIRITRTSRNGTDVAAAYMMLGDLNETSVIPDIIEFVCGKEKTWEAKSNAVRWLQDFSAIEQEKALEQIVARASDIDAAAYARDRLGVIGWEADEERQKAKRGTTKY